MSETSQYSSEPVETYEFQITNVGTLRYTSDRKTVIAESVSYAPLAGLARNATSIVTNVENKAFQLTLPVSHFLSRTLAMFGTPKECRVIYKRYQRAYLSSPPEQTAQYLLNGATISDDVCTLSFPPVFQSALAARIPKRKVQGNCNWDFCDENCTISKASVTVNFTGANVYAGTAYHPLGRNVYQIDIEANAPFQLRLLKGGIVTVAGQKRTINYVFNVDGSVPIVNDFSWPARIQLNDALPEYDASTPFEIMPGCDNSKDSCMLFANFANFGGFPFIPTEKLNPFTVDYSRLRK